MDKSLTEMTLQDFRDIEICRPTKKFNAFTIVPTEEIHDSGYRCMKFVLDYHGEIVGCVGGWSDVVDLNGIGGYGNDWNTTLMTGKTDIYDWVMDCLTESVNTSVNPVVVVNTVTCGSNLNQTQAKDLNSSMRSLVVVFQENISNQLKTAYKIP